VQAAKHSWYQEYREFKDWVQDSYRRCPAGCCSAQQTRGEAWHPLGWGGGGVAVVHLRDVRTLLTREHGMNVRKRLQHRWDRNIRQLQHSPCCPAWLPQGAAGAQQLDLGRLLGGGAAMHHLAAHLPHAGVPGGACRQHGQPQGSCLQDTHA